ncbi:MAG: Na(+)/H(+) antiporter subunit D [Deltaproteobacteria bacterium]|nr:Na(+)/H(+) antiporter subunit D [Deltaproteobacteria bacterium]
MSQLGLLSTWIHPGAILVLGAFLLPLFKGRVKKAYLLLMPALAFVLISTMEQGVYGVIEVFGQEMVFGRADKLAIIFAYIFSIAAFISILYGLRVKEDGHHFSSLIYAGSAIGVAFAGDFLTLLVFWEFMAFSSVFLILYRRTESAYKAAYRYVLVHAVSGVCLMGGIFLQYQQTKSMAFVPVEVGGLAAALILIGFLINAAVPPFGAWLPDAYPQATISGAVFMSAFTTKSAVYALARGFAGTEILIGLGVFMALYGVVYAVLENDIRRLLAYHIISQVGYMVAAVGIGTQMAINGACAHAFAHILYKGLLFMGTGSVIYATGKSKLSELGGVYKYMPITFALYMIGGFAISSVPLFSGFVSKSMVLSAAAEEHMSWTWLLLVLASAGTFLHTGLKLPYYTFMAKDQGAKGEDPPLNMILAMGIGAFLCIFVGVYPKYLYDMLPYATNYIPYTTEHIVWTGQILLFTWFGFYLYIKKLGGEETVSMDTDWFYRLGGGYFMVFARRVAAKGDDFVSNLYKTIVLAWGMCLARLSYELDKGVVDGLVNGVARFFVGLGGSLRRFQTGQLHDYALSFALGAFILISFLILVI